MYCATLPIESPLWVPDVPNYSNLHESISFATPRFPYHNSLYGNVETPQFYHYPPMRHPAFPSCMTPQYHTSKNCFSDFKPAGSCPVQNMVPFSQLETKTTDEDWLLGETMKFYETPQKVKEHFAEEAPISSVDLVSSNFSGAYLETLANIKYLGNNVMRKYLTDGKPSTRHYDNLKKSKISSSTLSEKWSPKSLNSKSFVVIEGEGLNPHPKKRRRNSEKRKEKSRDAARCRRGKESEIFSELGKLLPISCEEGASLDKASVIRIAIAYLRTRNLATYVLSSSLGPTSSSSSSCGELPVGLVEAEETPDDVILQSLDGFLLVLTKEGDIIYTSKNISSYLGVSQVDVMGQSLLDYTHPCDHDEVRHITSTSKTNDLTHCFVRFKSTLTQKGRNVNLKSATYKVVQMTGQIFESRKEGGEDQSIQNSQPWVVALGVPVPHPSNIEVPLDKQSFVSKHSLDMKFTYVDENVFNFCGYGSDDLIGRSLYEMNHALDTPLILEAYKILRAKGQVETGQYRFLSHGGGFVWVVTQATLITGHKDNKPQYVVCLNYVISEVISPDVIFSEYQLQTSISNTFVSSEGSASIDSSPAVSPDPSPPTTPIPKLIKDTSPQRTCHKKPTPPVPCRPTPVAATCSLLRDWTDDMNEGYLTFNNDDSEATVLKEEPEDLTHLAPSGGDDCVPIFIPIFDDFLVDIPSSFSVSPQAKFHQESTPIVKTSVDPLSNFLSPANVDGKKEIDMPIHHLCYESVLDQKINNLQGPRVVPQVHQKQTFNAFSRFDSQGLSFSISHKVPDQEVGSPLAGESWSPRQRFNTPEPPRTPTPLLSQAASLLKPENIRHLSSFIRPSQSIVTSRPFADLNSISSPMDYFTNFDLKLEEDLDIRSSYMPDIDEVPFFGTGDIFLSNSSDHSNRSSLNDDDDDEESHSSTKSLERGNSPFGLSSQYMDTSPSFHNQKSNADTGGGFVDPNQVLPGQNIKGEEGEDSSNELRYLLEDPPPSPVKEIVEPPPPLKPRLSVKRGLSPQFSPSVSRKRIRPLSLCLGRCPPAPTRKEPSPLLPPPHSPIMQQLLVSKDPIQIRARGTAPFERSAPSCGVNQESKNECSSSSSHSVLRNLLVSGRDDMEGYNVASGHSTDNLLSSPESPQSSDGASDDKSGDEICSAELDSLASIPLNRDGKVELTREQLSVLLSKAGVLRHSLNSSNPNNTLQKTSHSFSSSSMHFTAMDKPFTLVDPNLTIPSLLDLTSQDCEVNAPAPTPSLLHGADLVMALDRSQ